MLENESESFEGLPKRTGRSEVTWILLLRYVAERSLLGSGKIGSEFEEDLRALSRLGLMKSIAIPGVTYQITDAGLRFLEQYRDHDVLESPTARKDPQASLARRAICKDEVTIVLPTESTRQEI